MSRGYGLIEGSGSIGHAGVRRNFGKKEYIVDLILNNLTLVSIRIIIYVIHEGSPLWAGLFRS